MFRNNVYTQTGNGNSLSFTGSFFSTDLNSTGSNQYTSVQVTYPGPGSPITLTPTSATVLSFQTGFFSTQAAMDTAFPTGTYTYTTTPSSLTTTLSYSANAFTSTLPFLTGTTFSALQGMNAGAPFTFPFSTFTPNALTTTPFLFLTIFDNTSGTTPYNNGFLPATTTSLTVPANTLAPSHSFTYQLIYSDRVIPAQTPPGAAFPPQIGFDIRTLGSFTTAAAVPEPLSLLLFAQSGLFLAWIIHRRRVQRAGVTPSFPQKPEKMR
jgi:hypothetical protein